MTIVGANGTMGRNMAGIFAAFGNARVYLISREKEESEKAVEEACESVRSGSIRGNLVPMDYSGLEACVSSSDLVLESVSEDWEIKKSVTERIAAAVTRVKHREILCGTSSSGLPVTKLAEVFPEGLRKHYYGIHMFNPPYTMTLCELVLTKYSSVNLTKELSAYLSGRLYRTVVEVQDMPAFLANRIGFQFINQALLCAEKYRLQGGIDYMDAVLGPFTGRMMAPLMTADFVGLDVHKAIVDNVYQNTEDFLHSSFRMPDYANTLVFEGKYGRKTGGGGILRYSG